MKTKVYCATIEHKHGTNFYVAVTEKDLYEELAGFCQEWWKEWDHLPEEPPADAKECVETYFDEHPREGLTMAGNPVEVAGS